jgi:hypothetical protein
MFYKIGGNVSVDFIDLKDFRGLYRDARGIEPVISRVHFDQWGYRTESGHRKAKKQEKHHIKQFFDEYSILEYFCYQIL